MIIMLEALGPVVSLFELLIEGITKVSNLISSKKKKSFQRKILELQLCLENIIDDAQEILSELRIPQNPDKKKKSDKLDKIKKLIYRQRHQLYRLEDHLHDDEIDEIMKLFTPELRRNIRELVQMKQGVITNLVGELMNIDNLKFSGNELILNTNIHLLEWDHDRFIDEGSQYTRNMYLDHKKTKIIISKRLKGQKKVVNDLIECSRRMSEFIKGQIDIESVIGIGRKK